MNSKDPWAPFAKKYKIHEESRLYVRLTMASGVTPPSELDLETFKKMTISNAPAVSGVIVFDGEETEHIVPSPHTSEGIPISVYKPATCVEVPAIFIYFHGGALVMGSRKTEETMAKIIARDSGAIVINPEYRLLPNKKASYAPFDDALTVTRWVLENKEAIGGKSKSKVGVGGFSSGGHIALGVTYEIHCLDFQICICPLVDTTFSDDTFKEFSKVPGMNEDVIKFLANSVSVDMVDYMTNPAINPMTNTNLELSPPTLFILAELDSFRGTGVEYVDKLRASGVKVQLEIIKGVPHAFFTLRKIFQKTSVEAFKHIATFLDQFQ